MHSPEPIEERILAAATAFRSLSGRAVIPMGGVEVRALLDHATSVSSSSKVVDVSNLPGRGGRVAPLLNVIPSETYTVAQASETARGLVAAPTAYNVVLPESSLTITAADVPARRFGAWIPVTNGALADRGVVEEVVRRILAEDLLRGLDAQTLNGDGVGENFLGLTVDAAITVQARGTLSNLVTIQRAAGSVRENDFAGSITVVMNAGNLLPIANDTAFKSEALDIYGIANVVTTSRIAVGTALVGSLAEAASLYVREEATLALSRDHADFFTKGVTAVSVEGRFSMKLAQPGAIIRVTGLA